MKNKKIIIITALATLVIGIGIGWLIFHQEGSTKHTEHDHVAMEESNKETIWTCAMHPQIRQNEPGKCPICGMDLTPLEETSSADDPKLIQLSDYAAKLANVETTKITSGSGENRQITLQGKIEIDERNITKIPAHFHGRIEKLYVNFTGEQVAKGQLLAEVYSPELIVAQEELLQSLKYKETNPPMYKAARNKLKFWKIADSEIERIEQSGEILTNIKIHSHHAGVVLERHVAEGDHVKMGDILFDIVNLNQLWALFDAYEKDLEWIKKGSQISFTVASIPGKTFQSIVSFIDPVINSQTRVAKVRAEVNNASGKLKPEMFAYGTLNIPISGKQQNILVPQSAVLWTGKKSLVYVKQPELDQSTFEYREITIGAEVGEYYIVKSGLNIGDEVVTNGAYTIDAAAQLSGKASMMSPEDVVSVTQVSTEKFLEGKTYDFRDQTPAAFREQLDAVIAAYLELKDGLVVGNEKATAKYSTELFNSLQKVNEDLLKEEAKAFWKEKKSFLMQHAKLCKEAPTMDGKRENFIYLSQPLIKLVEAFGPGTEKLYVDYCPMANNNKGAFWLSETKEIRNPFMAETMLSCGEVKKEIPSN